MGTQSRQFPPVRDPALGLGHRPTCACGQTIFVRANTAGPGGLPDEAVIRRISSKGWRTTRSGRGVECQDCTKGKVRPLMVEQAVKRCLIPGCASELVIDATGKNWPVSDNGKVKVPPSICRQRAAAKGWGRVERNPDEYACPLHVEGYSGGKIVLDFLLTGERTWEKRAGQVGYDATTVLEAAERHAQAAYGDKWEGMKLRAIEGARELESITTQAAAAAQREEDDDMATLPTREQKRTIMDHLNTHYDGDGWAGDWSDAKSAEALNLPKAWVASVRSEFFGDDDVNEAAVRAAKERDKQIHQLRKDVTSAQRQVEGALDKVAESERTLQGISARLAKLEGN